MQVQRFLFLDFITLFFSLVPTTRISFTSFHIFFKKFALKVGSLGDHTKHKAGGGDKKIESRKLEWNVTSKVEHQKVFGMLLLSLNIKMFCLTPCGT